MTRRVVRVAVVLLVWSLAAASASAAKVTIDDLMRLRSLLDVRISPDGTRVAYVVSSPSIERAVHEPVLYVVPTAGGTPVRLTYGTTILNQPLPAAGLRWSPDGQLLSFVALVDNVPQIVAMPVAGGEPRPLTSVRGGVAIYEWAPDGKSLAFLARDPAPADEEQRRREKTFVIEVDRHPTGARLWVQNVDTKAPKVLTPIGQFVSDVKWAPDGRSLVFTASDITGFMAQYRTRTYTVSAEGGAPRLVADRRGMNKAPQFSPDGQWIAFVSSGTATGMIANQDLLVMPADGALASTKNLTGATDAWVGEFIWARDSRSIFYSPDAQLPDTGSRIFERPIYRVSLDSGRSVRITPDATVNYSLSLSSTGSLAYKSVTPRNMGEVQVMNIADQRTRTLTDINPELKTLELGSVETIHWPSFDGKEIWGLLLTPPGYVSGTRVPLVVYCHGGPIGGFTYGLFPQFMHTVAQVDPYPAEAMASEGMAILFPMPRGGSGYGLAGFRAIVNAWGEGDYRDIMAGVDHVIARGVADPNRLGVMGASYGGYMTDWIVTQTGRFRAASTAASISDIAQLYYVSDAGEVAVEYFGLPWEKAATFASHSPITHVAKVTTPLLIQHGENDQRVPIGQARAFYRALTALGKTVEFEIYPRGSHVNVEPPLEREYMRRNLEWFKRYLK